MIPSTIQMSKRKFGSRYIHIETFPHTEDIAVETLDNFLGILRECIESSKLDNILNIKICILPKKVIKFEGVINDKTE